jgi:hypothetical protein
VCRNEYIWILLFPLWSRMNSHYSLFAKVPHAPPTAPPHVLCAPNINSHFTFNIDIGICRFEKWVSVSDLPKTLIYAAAFTILTRSSSLYSLERRKAAFHSVSKGEVNLWGMKNLVAWFEVPERKQHLVTWFEALEKRIPCELSQDLITSPPS